MSQVHFAFQEGFSNDTVVLRVNGKEIVRKSGLSSQPTIALAGVENVSIEPGSRTVMVEVPTRGISTSFEVDFGKNLYVGISIVGSAVSVKRSQEPFEYM